jgi:hypothetical protein
VCCSHIGSSSSQNLYAAQICSISPTQDNLGSRQFFIWGQGESQELQNKSSFLAICAIANALDEF